MAAATSQLLAQRGHDVTVVCPHMSGAAPVERWGTLELHRALRRTALPQTFADPLDTWRFARRWRPRPDVVVAHQATVATGMLAARIGAPLVHVFHASAPLEQTFLRDYATAARRASSLALHPTLVLLERTAVRRAASILVLSEFSRRLVVSAHEDAADRVVVVRGGVDTGAFAPGSASGRGRERFGIPEDGAFLVSVRRLEPRMGLEDLLRAVRLLVDREVKLTLAIAGEGMSRQALHALACDLEIESSVRFLGRVSEEELPQLYAAADLFVLPTLAYEGFGMATIEALASGTPVVGTAVGATPELLGPLEPRLIAPSATPVDLAETIYETLSKLGPALRDRCATYAREQYDWRVVVDDWAAVIERMART